MSRPTVQSVLRQAIALLEGAPYAWCTHALAKNEKGKAVAVHSEHAVAWSATGAIYKVARGTGLAPAAIEAVQDVLGCQLQNYNDTPNRLRPHVITAMRKAIKSAEKSASAADVAA